MARKRMISPEFWTDEKIGGLNVEARLLFMGLISNADDEGRLPGNSMLIKSMIFPYDSYTVSKIEDWLLLLCNSKLVFRYKINEQTYIQVINFLKHQTINRPTTSKIPEYLQCNDDSMNDHGELMDSSLPKEDKLKEDKRKESNYSIEFEEWYSEYPRPEAKADSFKNFEKVRKDKGLDYIWQCTRNYIDYRNSFPEDKKPMAYQSNNFFGQKQYCQDYETEKKPPKDNRTPAQLALDKMM